VAKGQKRSNREKKKPKTAAAAKKTAAETVAARFQTWAKPAPPKDKGK